MFLTTGSGAVHVYDTTTYTTSSPPPTTTTTTATSSYTPSSPIHTINAHTANVYSIDVDPKGRYIATGGADALAALIDLQDLTCIHTFGRSE